MNAVIRPPLVAGLAVACWLLAVPFGGGQPTRAQEQEVSLSAVPELGWQRIPAGTFRMGCVQGDEICAKEETPRHAVQITKPFDLMATEDWTGHILQLPFDADPGRRFDYSNISSFLLSAVLTRATGQDTLSYAREHLFAPGGCLFVT